MNRLETRLRNLETRTQPKSGCAFLCVPMNATEQEVKRLKRDYERRHNLTPMPDRFWFVVKLFECEMRY